MGLTDRILSFLAYDAEHDAALVAVIGLVLAAVLLAVPPRRRAPVVLATAGAALLGSAFTLFVRLPPPGAPDLLGEFTMFDLMQGGVEMVLLAGMLCAVVAACSARGRTTGPGRPGTVGLLAGVLLGLGSPYRFRPQGEQTFYPVFPGRAVPAPDGSGVEMIVHDGVADTALGLGSGLLAIALLVTVLVVLSRRFEPAATGILVGALAGTVLTLAPFVGRLGAWILGGNEQLTLGIAPGQSLVVCALAGVLGAVLGARRERRSGRRRDLEARRSEA